MKSLPKLKTLLASLALASLASVAQAEPMRIQGYQANGVNYGDYVVGAPVYSGLAALWNVTNTDTSTSFLAYCLELLERIDGSAAQDYTAGAYAPSADVQELYDRYYGTVLNGRAQAVGFQLALWDLTGQADLATFSAPADAIAQATLLLDGVANATTPYTQNRYIYRRWSNDGLQDVLQVSARNEVPEPQTHALLLGGLGLIAAGMAARRRKHGPRA